MKQPAHLISGIDLKHFVEFSDGCQICCDLIQPEIRRTKGIAMKHDDKFQDPEMDLPEAIRSGLKNRYGPVPDVPSEIDSAILADARQHFEESRGVNRRLRTRRRISAWQWTAIASTIAAACVAFVVWRPQPPRQQNESFLAMDTVESNEAHESDSALNTDIDRNGRVDILDAFAMARQIRDGDSRARDFNRDGWFDQLDIDLVAREAVKL